MLWPKKKFGKTFSLGNKKKGGWEFCKVFWAGGNGTKSPNLEQKKLEFAIAKFRPELLGCH
jgi:hypothetical protein